MTTPPPPTIDPPAPRRVDVHCHCLPAVDDGPRSVFESIELCRALVGDGFTDVIATPHQLGRWEETNHARDVRSLVAKLAAILAQEAIPLRLHAGGEVRVDERLPEFLSADRVLTLADGGRYLLIELALTSYIPPEALLAHLASVRPTIVLAHPERYVPLQRDPAAAERWLAGGARLQVNADALTGATGPASKAAALDWIARGWVSLVATDAHDARTRRPRMTDAIELIREHAGDATVRRVCIDNPLRVLQGMALED